MAAGRTEFEIEASGKGKVTITPLPTGKCWALYLANFTDSICFTFLFPFLPYLVEFLRSDYLETVSVEDHDRYVSIYSGILGSCYSIAQFLSSFIIGFICDKYGKRPVLIFGSICNAVGTLGFAFVRSYPMAIAVRLFTGFCNANAVASRSLLADFTDKTNRTLGFTYLNVFAILGAIVGPFMGGMLAEPNKRYPSLFQDFDFFNVYPFSLACFACLSISLAGVYLAVFYVFDEKRGNTQNTNPLLEGEVQEEQHKYTILETLSELRKNTAYLTLSAAWCITGLTLAMTTELTALWGKSAYEHGGLGWEEEYKIGLLFAWGSGVLLVFLILFIRKLIDKYGYTRLLLTAQLIASPVVLNFPSVHYLSNTFFLWPALMTVSAFWGICIGTMLTTVQLGLNSVVQPVVFTQELLGSANGVALSIVALVRSLGPLTAGTLFGWSLNSDLGFPFNFYFVYFLEAILLLMSFIGVKYASSR